MAGKNSKEELAWQEYLASIEEKPEEKKKGFDLEKSLKKLLKKIGLGKEKEEEQLKDQAAITAQEAKEKTFGREKPALEKMDASSLEKYFNRIEEKRKLEAEIAKKEAGPGEARVGREKKLPVQPGLVKKAAEEIEQQISKKPGPEQGVEKKPFEGKPEAEKQAPKKMPAALAWKRPEKKPKEKAPAGKQSMAAPEEEKKAPIEKKLELMPKPGEKKGIEKKIAFLPKAIKEAIKPKGKKGKEKKPAKGKEGAEKPEAGKKAPKKMPAALAWKRPAKKTKEKEKEAEKKEEKAPEPEKGEAIVEFLSKRPSLADIPVSEIEKMPKEEIERRVKMEKIANKARGWYGDRLRHKRAALIGWRIRKKATLQNLRKKEKAKKLSKKEKAKKKKLLSDDQELREELKTLDQKIRTLKKIAKQKETQEKALEEKVKAVGVEIPEAETQAIEKGRKQFKKKTEMSELIDAMRVVAVEMAAVATRQDMRGVSWKQALTVDDQIHAQERLIKNLETAFYKRKVDFDQFREKLFEHQSKLAELKIKKKLAEERKKSLPLEIRQAMEQPGFEKTPMAKQPVTAALSPEAVRALEKLAKKPGTQQFQEQTSEAIQKLAEEETERKTETQESRRFAEKTAEALQKIAEKLNAVQPQQPPQVYWQPPPQQPAAEKGKPEQAPAEKPGSQPAQQPQQDRQQAWRQPQPQPYQPIPPEASRMVVEKGKPRRGRKPKKAQRVIQAEPVEERQPERVIERIIERPGMERMRKAIERDEREEALRERSLEERERAVSQMEKEAEEKQGEGKKLLERIKEKIVPGAKHEEHRAKIGKDLDRAIREKAAAGHVSRKQVDRIEEKLGELLEKYKIPENALAAHVQTLDSNRLVQDFQKLISLIERKKEDATAELIKPAPGFDISTGVIARKREKLIGKEKDIIKTKIETSFDRLLRLVQLKGIINLNDAAKQLGMNKKDVQECAEILERNKLIQLNYPPIGAVKLVYPGYLEWKQKQKVKEREEKKNKK
jgi:hypothetical protein